MGVHMKKQTKDGAATRDFDLYLVTGALGHLGNTLIRMLRRQGCRVRGLVLPGDPSPALSDVEVALYAGDVRDRDSLQDFFSWSADDIDPSRVVLLHTAGIVSIGTKYSQQVVDVNVQGTRNIIDACVASGIGRLVYTSSVHAIPEAEVGETIVEVDGKTRGDYSGEDVVGLYAKTKAMATRLVLDAVDQGLDAVVVHPSGIIGPGDYGSAHMTQMVLDYMQGRLTAYVRGGYDFVDVRDVAQGMLAAAARGRTGETYILSNRYVELREWMHMLRQISGKKRALTLLPMTFAKWTAPLAELWYKMLRQPPLFTRYSLYTLESNAQFSHEKATRELGYHPRPIEETLTDMIAWLRSQGRISSPPAADAKGQHSPV